MMTKGERSLLLYLETRAVDHAGKVDCQHMNGEDFKIAEQWNERGFLFFRRRKACLFVDAVGTAQALTHVVKLSDAAWETVALLRCGKAERTTVAEKEAANR